MVQLNCPTEQFILTLSLGDNRMVVPLVLSWPRLVKQMLVGKKKKRAELHFFSVSSSTYRPNSVSVG